MKGKGKEKIQLRICEHLYNTQEAVGVKPVQGLFNYRCFENAVQYATTHKDVEVIMGIIVNQGKWPTLHFWNKKGKQHLETSIGYRYSEYTYYPLKTVAENDYSSIGNIFDEAVDYWWQTYTKWWQRPFIEDGRIV